MERFNLHATGETVRVLMICGVDYWDGER